MLIDSPGINPFRPADLCRLSQSLDASGASPVLVLDAGAGSADAAEVAETFPALGCRSLLVTKLGVAQRLAGVPPRPKRVLPWARPASARPSGAASAA